MASQFTSIKVTSQPTGSGIFAPPTESNHFVPKGWLETLLAPLSQANHAPATTVNTLSIALQLISGTQQLRADVRRKTSSLSTSEGLLAETAAGLVVVLGSGANQAARGSDVAQLQTDVAGKAAAVHSHAISDIAGLQSELDGKAPSAHSHAIADVSGLQSALNAKSPSGHVHIIGDINGLSDALASKANASSTWEIANINGLEAALAGKASSTHGHVIADISGLQTALDAKASTSHTHASATNVAAGFLSAADKSKLDSLSANEHWRESVATFDSLPINTDPIGTVRLVRDTGVPWRCISQTGFRADQWRITGSTKKFSATVGDGVALIIDCTHNLATKDIIVSLRDLGTDEMIFAGVKALDEYSVRLTFGAAPGMSGVRLVVMG